MHEIVPVGVGVGVFGGTLAVSTLAQKLMGISTGTAAGLPVVAGFATVCVASVFSHHAATACHQYIRSNKKNRLLHQHNIVVPHDFLTRTSKLLHEQRAAVSDYIDVTNSRVPLHTIRM
jgi:hypothetical protein